MCVCLFGLLGAIWGRCGYVRVCPLVWVWMYACVGVSCGCGFVCVSVCVDIDL